MGLFLSRTMLWRLVLLPSLILLSATMALGQSTDTEIRHAIDATALQIAAVVTRAVPDDADTIMAVQPVFTDTELLTPLGAGLRGALQVTLLRDYDESRLLADPLGEVAVGLAVRVMVELQPFGDGVLVLVRIVDRDGFLIEAALIEMTYSPAIPLLLQQSSQLKGRVLAPVPTPDETSSTTEPSVSSRLLQRRASVESSKPAMSTTLVSADPYEPDDVPGFEVPVPTTDSVHFERFLTRGDRDRFEVSIPKEATIIVASESSIETLLVLYHVGDAVPFRLHDGQFTQQLQAGTYILEVIAADAEASGRYALSVRSEARAPSSGAAVDESDGSVSDGSAAEVHNVEASLHPTELRSGQPQERVLQQLKDWIALTAVPGFYGVTLRSQTNQLLGSLYHAKDGDSFLQLVRSAPDKLVGALFIGVDVPHLLVETTLENLDKRYTVSLDPIEPPRVFADQTWVSQSTLGLVRYHSLRVFRQEVYLITLESTALSRAQVAIFQLPAMTPVVAQETAIPGRYSLAPGDYLVITSSVDTHEVGRVCWRRVVGSRICR